MAVAAAAAASRRGGSAVRGVSSAAAAAAADEASATAKEREIEEKLRVKLAASKVVVKDVSGGCGSFYDVTVASEAFKGKSVVQQHRLVQEAIKADIKALHGLTIKTSVA